MRFAPILLCISVVSDLRAQPGPDIAGVADASFDRHGIRIYSRGHPEFRQRLKEGLRQPFLDALAPAADLVVVVENRSSRTIRKIVVSYPRTLRDGGIVPANLVLTMNRPGVGGLVPGGRALLGPDHELSFALELVQGNQVQDASTLAKTARSTWELVANPRRFSKVSVIVDSIVFTDGQIIGRDQYGLQRSGAWRLEALTDLKNRLEGLKGDPAGLRNWLVSEASANPKPTDFDAIYRRGVAEWIRGCVETRAPVDCLSGLDQIQARARSEYSLVRGN